MYVLFALFLLMIMLAACGKKSSGMDISPSFTETEGLKTDSSESVSDDDGSLGMTSDDPEPFVEQDDAEGMTVVEVYEVELKEGQALGGG